MKTPYMTMNEAAEYLRFDGERVGDRARQFLQRSGVRLLRRGREYLVRQESIDRFLETGESELDCRAAGSVGQLRKENERRGQKQK
jgi:hypothetical protein